LVIASLISALDICVFSPRMTSVGAERARLLAVTGQLAPLPACCEGPLLAQ
jgi:hypothetical protein